MLAFEAPMLYTIGMYLLYSSPYRAIAARVFCGGKNITGHKRVEDDHLNS